MASDGMLPVDWAKVTLARNPFLGPGAAVCDPSSPREKLTYVDVGITKAVTRLITKCLGVGSVQHFLVLAPLGYGKSRSFAAAMAIAKVHNAVTLYVKFSNYRGENSADVILGNLCRELLDQACEVRGLNHNALVTRFSSEETLSPLDFLPRLHEEIGCKWLFVLLDEIEKLLESQELPLDHKINILNVFKHWAEYGKEGYVLGLAGTSAVLGFLTTTAPEFVDRFEVLRDDGFSQPETLQFVAEKCQHVLGPTKIVITESVAKNVHGIARGIPRLIESIAHECWNWAASTSKVVDGEQFNLMVSEVYGLALKETCRSRGFTEEKMDVILKLLKFGGKARLRDLLDHDDLPTYRYLGKWLLALAKETDSKVVERSSHGVYEISDQFMRELIRRKLARRS